MKQIWSSGLGLVKSSSVSFHSWMGETNQGCEDERVVGALVLLPSQLWTSYSPFQPFPACPSRVLGSVVMLSPTAAHPRRDVTCDTVLWALLHSPGFPPQAALSLFGEGPSAGIAAQSLQQGGGLAFSEK